MTDAAALAMLDRLAAYLDPVSLDYAAEQWLEYTHDDQRRDWFERMEMIIAYWQAPERTTPAPPRSTTRRP